MCKDFVCVHSSNCINEFICEEYRAYCAFRTPTSTECDICKIARACAKGKAVLAKIEMEKKMGEMK